MSKKHKKDWSGSEAQAEMVSAQEQPEESGSEKIDFDSWWAMRSKMIPSVHHKEVVKADIMARGLSGEEKPEDYDAALVKYGIKIS